jgi:hypothetical protein
LGGSADDWFATPPAGSDPLYVSTGTFEINGTTGTDNTVDWTAPSILVQDGAQGTPGGDGNSVFVGNVFLRKSTAPTEPVTDDGSYNFTTNTLTPPSIAGGSADNWSVTVPAGSDPLYVSHGTFEINGTTGTDNTVDWTAPVVLASDGADGAAGGDGNSVHVANVYLRKATAPTEPVTDDGSYNFTTNTLTPPSIAGGSADDWSVTVPAGTDPLYVSAGTFEINGTTGTDSTVDWTAPTILASDGTDGDDGLSVHVANVYKRSPTTPATPSVDDGQYNFTTQVLTPPAGWSVEVPEDTELKLWYDFAKTRRLSAAQPGFGPSLSFARDSIGTYFDSAGVLRTVGVNQARFDHNPDTKESLGLLIEEERTNLVLHSGNLADAVWDKSTDNIDPYYRFASAGLRPDGKERWDLMGSYAGNTRHQVIQAISGATAQQYCLSVYAKLWPNDGYMMLGDGGDAAWHSASFNLNNGTVADTSGVDSASIEKIGTDVYRCIVIFTRTNTTNFSVRFGPIPDNLTNPHDPWDEAVEGDQNIAFFGAQLELGDSPTSYIPTAGAAVTRKADDVTTTDLSWFTAATGTWYAKGSFQYVSTDYRLIFQIDDGSNSDRIFLTFDPTENINFGTTHSADANGASDGTAVIAVNTEYEVSATYADDDVIAYVDGTASPADNTAALPVGATLTTLRIGHQFTPAGFLNGHLKEFRYYNTRKTNTFLDDLSSSLIGARDPLYVSTGSFSIIGQTGTDTTVTWTAPDLLTSDGSDGAAGDQGGDGANAITSELTNPAHVVQAANDGTGYSLTGAGGTHKVFDGDVDVTVVATHSVSGSATKNGLTMSVVSTTGVYSLSGGSWTSDQETFTLRAVYGGKTLDKEYTIAKAKAGATGAGFRVTAIGVDITDVAIDPADAEVAYRVDSDGDVYKRIGTGGGYVSAGTWLQSGANTDYECLLTVNSGDDPTSGSALDSWLACTADRTWILTETVLAGAGKVNSCTIKIRDDITFEVLSEAEVLMAADVESGG